MAPRTWYDGLKFGGGAIRESDWRDILEFVQRFQCRTILEIGAGYSTLLFDSLGLHVVSYETDAGFIDALRTKLSSRVELRHFVYPHFSETSERFDAALVDGPGAGNFDGRKASMYFACQRANNVFIHDSSRAGERASMLEVFQTGWSHQRCPSGMTLIQRSS